MTDASAEDDPSERPRSAEPETAVFLRGIGERVRLMRARRGMSRKLLSRQCKVSERYLAQLESGSGNASIVLLRRVARGLSIPLVDLISEGPEPPVDAVLLHQLLDRLSVAELEEARELLFRNFSVGNVDARTARIALIGLRGAGKSTLGRRLAEHRNVPFVELDKEVERVAGIELREIFEIYGQSGFRRFERTALETLIGRDARIVLATGGSLVTEAPTFERLLSTCCTVWIKADPEEHMQRVIEQGDLRPMRDNRQAMDDLKTILASREPLYAKADLVLDTSRKTADQSLRDLLGLVEGANAGVSS